MAFTAQDVVALRERTGVGMMDCKKALQETDGNIEKAIEYLRKKGMASVAKRASRIASQGIIDSYIHFSGKFGVLVEVNCETDFVAKSPDFVSFVHDIALQIGATNPTYISMEDVPADVVARERDIIRAQTLNDPIPRPEAIIDKIVDARMSKFYQESCLLEQDFVKDTKKTMKMLFNEIASKIGEKIVIRRFVRYMMGEGLEKKEDTFVQEINDQLSKLQQ
ncbi:MAG: translation elongation factor Ts [Christensenellaceae bacterium]|jgi:elongation factor Ts|nr:translation elongation factor Ts [Christensenellaceae bacterium]